MASTFNSMLSLLTLFFLQLLVVSHSEAKPIGFSLDLIHRDSPQSQLYNPSITEHERLDNAFKRSTSRAASFRAALTSDLAQIHAPTIPTAGEYLMKLSLGTPPFEFPAIADTGSDVTWTQCKPCKDCFKQIAPLFDPSKSSSYKNISCSAQACSSLPSYTCDKKNNCLYEFSYGDGSFSDGNLAVETFTFNSTSGHPVQFNNVVFGCGHSDQGTFNKTTTGIVGLGGGNQSIIRQLSDSIQGKFSYCLVPRSSPDVTSKINFGKNAGVSGRGVVTTPIIKQDPATFYYLTLESVTVGATTLGYSKSSLTRSKADFSEGNIIIDSGTTLTFLPIDFYDDVEAEVQNLIKGEPVEGPLSLCYKGSINNVQLPNLTFKFTGAELVLFPNSTFIQADEHLFCLALVPAEDIAIFGNLAQMNFLIGYDLIKNQLSFKPTDCTKH